MNNLIATFGISAALLAPATAYAATTPVATTPAPTSDAPVATSADARTNANATSVAMAKQTDRATIGRQANDDRQGLSRMQEFSHQLGATN